LALHLEALPTGDAKKLQQRNEKLWRADQLRQQHGGQLADSLMQLFPLNIQAAQTLMLQPRIACLSIQQPWAAMILSGEKVVENRCWRWNNVPRSAKWKVTLGIHSSKGKQEWSKRTAAEKDKYVPDWRDSGSLQFGSVLGIVDLVCICRPNELPLKLRKHRFVNHNPKNWCWVLENPRRLAQPIPRKGQASLFYVAIPDAVVCAGLPVGGNGMATGSRFLTVTEANLKYGSLNLAGGHDLFPKDVFGESSKEAERKVRIMWGDEVFETDIVRPKNIFRCRKWGQFFDANRIQAQDRILLEQLTPYLYRISKA
jgi:hypothetical protein